MLENTGCPAEQSASKGIKKAKQTGHAPIEERLSGEIETLRSVPLLVNAGIV